MGAPGLDSETWESTNLNPFLSSWAKVATATVAEGPAFRDVAKARKMGAPLFDSLAS
jgi:hypothetical protein